MSYSRLGVREQNSGVGGEILGILTLGFARERLDGPGAGVRRAALEQCGRVFPWVAAFAVLVWAQGYGMGFIATLAFLEIQAVILGVATALFVPRCPARTFLDLVVNAFLVLLAFFLAMIVVSFLVGFVLLILSEAD